MARAVGSDDAATRVEHLMRSNGGSFRVAWRVALILGLAAAVSVVSPVDAHAECTVTTASTSGVTIAVNGTGTANTIRLCVTNDIVLWGLYGTSNGTNPDVDAYESLPATGSVFYRGLDYSTSKASYTVVPVPVPYDYTQVPEYDITVNTMAGGGSDTITLWYASRCSHANQCDNASRYTDTSFTITVVFSAPTVTAIWPAAGGVAGGTLVTISGTNFVTGASGVAIGDLAAGNVTVVSATTITATTPAHAASTVDVGVTSPLGTGIGTSLYTYVMPPTFSDEPIQSRTTAVKVVHVTELRQAIDQLRTRYGLPGYVWTDPVLTAGTSEAKLVHLTDLRTALNAVYLAAGVGPPAYTTPSPSAGTTVVAAAQIEELRAAVLAIW
jgi:hypothetical protein